MDLTSFTFSQSSLQDYIDCNLRFYRKYGQRLSWPALDVNSPLEHEANVRRGLAFHRFVQQSLIGVPVAGITTITERDEHLERWWQSFLRSFPRPFPEPHFAETSLAGVVGGVRLMATYDLIVSAPKGQLEIYDWKTVGKPARRNRLVERAQSIVYPYLLAKCGHFLLGSKNPVDPNLISMRYWFTERPDQMEVFQYSQTQFEQDEAWLLDHIKTIASMDPGDFSRTDNEKMCGYCKYRSLCNKNMAAHPEGPDGENDYAFEQSYEAPADYLEPGI